MNETWKSSKSGLQSSCISERGTRNFFFSRADKTYRVFNAVIYHNSEETSPDKDQSNK